MKQKVVIKVSMNDDKSRKKAFKTVVGHSGVESTALQGKEMDQIEVVGDGIDAVKLTTLLRKNVGYAELVTVGPVGEKKDGDNKKEGANEQPVAWSTHPYVYSSAPHHLYQVRDHPYYDDSSCTIM